MIKDKRFAMLYRKMIDEAYSVQKDAEEQKALLFQRLEEVTLKTPQEQAADSQLPSMDSRM